MKSLHKSISLAPLLALLISCNADLTPLVREYKPSFVDVNAQFCTATPAVKVQKNKYLFIIDHSQSNGNFFPIAGSPSNTDVHGQSRYSPIFQFVFGLNPTPGNSYYFNIIDFSSTASIPSGLSTTSFDGDQQDFLNQLIVDWTGNGNANNLSPTTGAGSDYEAALKQAYALISSDANNELNTQTGTIVPSYYQIFFITDELPLITQTTNGVSLNEYETYTSSSAYASQCFSTSNCSASTGTTSSTSSSSGGNSCTAASQSGGNSSVPYVSNPAFIKDAVDNLNTFTSDNILGAYVSGVSLNTIYYYPATSCPNACVQTLLQQMATDGNGGYFDYGVSGSGLYANFAPTTKNIKNVVADAFVQNLNAVWWDDGELLPDSDGDGLPDPIEIQVGSNPFKADSDGNGVSDLVEYRTKGAPCSSSGCSAQGRDPYPVCTRFSSTVLADGSVSYASTSNDGLNDCEKFVLGGVSTQFSSTGDFIPDFMALVSGISFTPGVSSSFSDPFGDGITNYQKLKMGLPISVSQKSNPFTARVTSVDHISSTPTQDCYNYTVHNVAILGDNNIIKFYVVQNSTVIDDTPVLKVAERAVNGHNSPVIFNPGDFQ